MAKKKRIVVGVTGSIAAYKAADLVRRLDEKGFKVSVMMTKEAGHFITPLTLSALSGDRVYSDMFGKDEEGWKMSHVDLAAEADAIVIAPATANIIAKMSCGLADDLLTCTVLGSQAPLIIAPAMNVEMYRNKIVQENCSRLKKNGAIFVDPVKGKLACGAVGEGHLADESVIVKAVIKALK